MRRELTDATTMARQRDAAEAAGGREISAA
jgi:hypothetical protein